MLLFLILILPILLSGILILRKTTNLTRIELLLPVGSILGLTLLTFFLNIAAFLIKGSFGIITAYLLTVCLGLLFFKLIKSKDGGIQLPQGKALILWIFSILSWSGLIFWKAAHALIGSDTNLYYSIAHSFIRGNFPPMTPWQPDLPLAYHLGTFELLGAFYFLTNLNFQFLHLFFSALFIICAVQIVIWIWDRHTNLLSFIIANLAALVAFISFGFLYLVLPNFPATLPHINNLNELVLWLRNLPTANQAIEVYGAPVNLDGLIYFIFHAFGFAIFLNLVAILIDYRKNNSLLTWTILAVSLSTLALVDESIFVAAAPAVIIGIFLAEINKGHLSKNFVRLLLLCTLTFLTILLQGGVITSAIFPPKEIDKSVILFPKKEDIKEDFTAYHYYQEISKMLPKKLEWGNLNWFHMGVDLQLLIGILILVRLKTNFRQFNLLLFLLFAGFTSLIAYNVIVPKFLMANGNRFLAGSFLFFSLVICLSLIQIINTVGRDGFFKKLILMTFILWLFIPTTLPPLAFLSKTRFGENMLVPKPQKSSEGIEWLKKNLPYNSNVVVLDIRAPHPSGMARVMVQAGVFAPVFTGQVRVYTIEASPEYLDIAYYLSPKALQDLKINYLLIDSGFFTKLPELRKKQLEEDKYFKVVFVNGNANGWEKVFEIDKSFFDDQNELPGTIREMSEKVTNGKIYIDNEEYFNPSFLRRAIIFSLRQKDLYFLPQSGVYLNVEADIRQSTPQSSGDYDYLVLGKDRDPEDVCKCQTKLIWAGFNNEIYVWQTITD